MLWELIDRLGKTSLTIRLSGEMGVGKEACARLIHQHYPHHDAQFNIYDCQALIRGDNRSAAIDSERSLHELHAVLASPENHVLYFTNIESMPAEIQASLERLLEDKSEKAPPWIISANNQPMRHRNEAGKLNKDLLASLQTIHVHIPPLRERPQMIPQLLAGYFNQVGTIPSETLPPMPDAQNMNRLTAYHWPGNLRQLQQIAHRALKLQAWDKVMHTIETRSIRCDDTIDEMAALYILSNAEIRIQREKVLEGLIAASNMEDIGLLDLAFFNEAVCQIADSVSNHNIDKGSTKKK